MCKYGEYERVKVTVPSDLSFTGKDRKAVKLIDKCIAPLVRALNQGGVKTRDSCCGHGKGQGYIQLWDGTVLHIIKDGQKWMADL
jgi:hypothetical protein